MSNEAERPEEHQDAEPKPNPSRFYVERARELDGQPALQQLVNDRAIDLLGADSWGKDPEDMKQGMGEAITFLQRTLDNPFNPDGVPGIIDLAEDKQEDQELGAELVALLKGDTEAAVEGIPQAGPAGIGELGSTYVETRIPIELPGWQLVRSRHVQKAATGGEGSARHKYYLEPVAPTS